MHRLTDYVGHDYRKDNCWQLVRKIYAEVYHVDLPRDPIERRMMHQFRLVLIGEEHEGDILVFKLDKMKRHVGVVLNPIRGSFIHTDAGIDACVQNYRHSTWKDRLVKVYRHRSL